MSTWSSDSLMKALRGSLSCAQLCSHHHSSTGRNTVGCLHWREDHELDCVQQTKGEPLSEAALPGCMKNRLCKLHNAPGYSQQCYGRPTGLALGQGGSRISSLPPSLPAWESSGELLCSQKKPPYLSPGKELCCSGVTSDAQRCGHGSEGSRHGGSLGKHLERETGEASHLFSLSAYHISVPHPVLVLFMRQPIPVLIILCITTGKHLKDRRMQ